MLTFLFFQGVAACVHTEMPILKQDLVELLFGLDSATLLFEEHVCILAVFEVTEFLLDDFGALGLL